MVVFVLLAFLALAVAAYLWRTSRPVVFVTTCVLICGATLFLALVAADRFYESRAASGRYVEGKGVFDAMFISAAFAGFWLALAATRILVEAVGRAGSSTAKIITAVLGFIVAFASVMLICIQVARTWMFIK